MKVDGVEIAPGTQLLDGSGYDWSWAFVVFREYPGWPGYLAGSDGTAWSCRKIGRQSGLSNSWHQLRPTLDDKGYPVITLWGGSKGKKRLHVHRFILGAFYGACPNNKEGCHNNGKPKDNRLVNLRWDTHKANVHDSMRHGTFRPNRVGTIKPGHSPAAKLREIDIPLIRSMHANGRSMAALAIKFNVSRATICRVLARKIWAHVG